SPEILSNHQILSTSPLHDKISPLLPRPAHPQTLSNRPMLPNFPYGLSQSVEKLIKKYSPTYEEDKQLKDVKDLLALILRSMNPPVHNVTVVLAGSRAKKTALRGADADFVVCVPTDREDITQGLRNKVATAIQRRPLQGREISWNYHPPRPAITAARAINIPYPLLAVDVLFTTTTCGSGGVTLSPLRAFPDELANATKLLKLFQRFRPLPQLRGLQLEQLVLLCNAYLGDGQQPHAYSADPYRCGFFTFDAVMKYLKTPGRG
ncbi:hypothetical protein BDK51DRAFT_32872, partial [Blyttiomyces helicus]